MLKEAFQFMWYDKTKMLGILSGIIISVFLIGQQLGIFFSMTDNMKGIAKNHNEYIWVLNNKTQSSMQLFSMEERIGRELYSVPAVTSVNPMVVAGGSAKFEGDTKVNVQLIGVSGPGFVGGSSILLNGATQSLLQNEGAVFADISDRQTMANIKVGDYFTINDNRVYLAGFTKGNSGFGSSYIFTTIERARSLSSMTTNQASVYLVSWDTTMASEKQVIQYINTHIPNSKAWSGKEFSETTYHYMMRTSNIAMSFGLMVVFALVAGFTIVGLTLYSSVNDRIRDYGTIKAIGGDNGLIRKFILYQAIIYAVIGYVIAFLMLLGVKKAMSNGRMEINYSPALVIFLITITLMISLLGSLLAMRRIIKLEPVQIFRM